MRNLRQTQIKVLSNNTTAVCAINNMGSCKSLLWDQIVRRIWSWAMEEDIFITLAHILGADQESWKLEVNKKLQNEIYLWLYSKISRYLPIVVLFASRINVQLPQFFAYRPDQTAEVINAFCVSFYCFVPSSYTGKVLKINFLTTLLIY